jgi:hypothetical protein
MLVRYVHLFDNYTIFHNKYTRPYFYLKLYFLNLSPVRVAIHDNDLYLVWLKMKPSSVILYDIMSFHKGAVKYPVPVPVSVSVSQSK